ncbi:hypothetical protein [Halovivax sp.]|uniref:DUF7118 family protein n=1 Tax=Halovivax sp. TaxID=1935978 RepID=UPI0025C48C49|nr:hypothetical protein [Halovivax sp.]
MSDRHRSVGSSAAASGTGSDASEAIDRLASAIEGYETVADRIEREGEDAVERGAEAYRNARQLLDHYEDRATGTGRENFKAYVQLEGQFATLVGNLPDELADSGPFESARDAIDKRRLSERDFERARDALAPAEEYADLVEEREAAREALADARKAANRHCSDLEEEIERRERLLELADVDLDAPVERLREPIATYDEAVREAFAEYRSSAPARELFAFLERTRWFPLVPFDRPPEDVREYVESNDAGELTVPELLEYAEYSRSKLSHHVDDADALKRQVATRRTYLQRIDAEPLTIDWPPAPAAELRYRIRELRPLVARIAREVVSDSEPPRNGERRPGGAVSGDEVVGLLREIRDLTRDPDYDRLQTAATAREGLSDEERDRLAEGGVEEELTSLRRERERIDAALERAASALDR